MKTLLKIAKYSIGVLLVLICGTTVFFATKYPDVNPAPALSVERTPSRMQRGAYLVNHVAVCMDCNSTRDWTKFSGPVTPGTEGMGGELFDHSLGFPGSIYAKNITPSGIGNLTDGELYRSLTEGVRKDGKPLFPLMPYLSYTQLSEEDLLSIIAYVRSLKPIENRVQETVLDFPVNLLVKTMPQRHKPVPEPNRSSAYEYGKYLANTAGCIDCHSQQVEGKMLEGMRYAGGMEFALPVGTVRSANITPDEQTGIGLWSKDLFVSRFKFYDKPGTQMVPADSVGYVSVMPWSMFAGMTEEDLGAIYTYLRTVPPVKNAVVKWTPASAPAETASK